MLESEVLTEIHNLETKLDQRLVKYTRNLMRYHGNNLRREQVFETDGAPLGYFFYQVEDDVGPAPGINILQSMIESSVSKLAQLKVRPYLNPINGDYETKLICRQGQTFFDELYDAQDLYFKARKSIRDAEIFEYGIHWIDDESKEIKYIRPWEFYCDGSEYTFGNLTHCHVKFERFPLIQLKDKAKKVSAIAERFTATPFPRGRYRIFWDLIGKEKWEFVENDLLKKSKIEYDVAPFSIIWYHPPVRGFKSTSLIDAQIRSQEQVDDISDKIHAALTLTPANTIALPKGSDVKKSMISNQIGQFVEYNPVAGITTPVAVITPAAIHTQYATMLEMVIKLAYEMEGISQLSASSKKPSGITSGVALQTLEDVESERHEVLVENYKRFLMQDALLAVQVFPENDDILPGKLGRSKIKFKEIKAQRDSYSIQFAATNFLSKDPSTRMGEIEKLVAMKFLTPAMASDYMDLPDQTAIDNIIGSSYQAGERVIERAIKDNVFDIPATLDYTMLAAQICTTYNTLDANDADKETLTRLSSLLSATYAKIKETQDAQMPPPPPVPPPVNLPAPKIAQPAAGVSTPGGIGIEGAPPPGPPAQ